MTVRCNGPPGGRDTVTGSPVVNARHDEPNEHPAPDKGKQRRHRADEGELRRTQEGAHVVRRAIRKRFELSKDDQDDTDHEQAEA